ncbi:hypothetical protein SmJEL517_g03685 [Synchytrium microbalum]|uniref:AB hydrolase-1 domain-containing protein n=1 Tax=Synchytrium microbalum TaxID=1806994 RepID=A0A507C1V0_9FUNG|nr:uncharacterized protein SmJEL517_g03685 [Synchytrium microbalum]TPX33401.1 hypothetical protein SmJEL517_g03685 [Synchytrium microbalum]
MNLVKVGLQQGLQQDNRPLLFFIHGFMSSGESFGSFPVDVAQYLAQQYQVKVDVDLYNYDTRGSNQARVKHLVTWLASNAGTSKRPWVGLIAHSMGGILSADAARAIDSIDSGKGWGFPPADNVGDSSRDDPELLARIRAANVKIRLVLAFDSPFYGLHQTVVTNAALGRMNDVGAGITNSFNTMRGIPPAGITTSTTETLSKTTTITSTTLVKESTLAAESSSASSSTNADVTTSTNAAVTTSTTTKALWGIAGAFAAVGVTAAMAYSATARDVAGKFAGKAFEAGHSVISQHAEFLGPLVQVKDMDIRLGALDRMQTEGKLVFQCFYIQIKKTAPPSANLSSGTTQMLQFINSPSSPVYTRYFKPIQSLGRDEIHGHQKIFDINVNPSSYPILVADSAAFISRVARTL